MVEETSTLMALEIREDIEWPFDIPITQALDMSDLLFNGSACDVFEFAHTLYHLLERLYGSGDKLATHTAPTQII